MKALEEWIKKDAGLIYIPEIDCFELFITTENGEQEIAKGCDLQELIDNIPNTIPNKFKDVKLETEFIYLNEIWVKIGYSKAKRKSDGFLWSFNLEEEINQ